MVVREKERPEVLNAMRANFIGRLAEADLNHARLGTTRGKPLGRD